MRITRPRSKSFSGMINKVLIANRGAIGCRIIRTLRRLGIKSVAVYSIPDSQSLHVTEADEAFLLDGHTASETYLDQDKLFAIAKQASVDAIHPGYGFLSENAGFARRCEQQGIHFIGPTAEHIEQFGLKHVARDLAAKNKLPLLPGTELLASVSEAQAAADKIGYPVMLKSTAGGGGIGMQLCHDNDELADAFETVKRLGENNFSDGGIFMEKFVARARHVEVQIFGNGKGDVVALGERDCSMQRRNQKVVEETPAPLLPVEVRQSMLDAATRLGADVAYRSAGTVEYIYDPASNEFYFLEVNTRLQVEHGVTEEVTGVDLVEWMVRLAGDDLALPAQESIKPTGFSIQVRLYAEDPGQQFHPSTGLVTEFIKADSVRFDTWLQTGTEVPAFYDPMLGKIIVNGETRQQAIDALYTALGNTRCSGIETNLAYLKQVIRSDEFTNASHYTRFLDSFDYHADTITVMDSGTLSTIQDYPGRLGYWHVGVPPSGPMDSLSSRLGNRLLENPHNAAGIELTATGPTLRFNCDSLFVLTGALMPASIDDKPIDFFRPHSIRAGAVLKLGAVEGAGMRSYLCIKGGIDVPGYLGSQATFTLGRFGGHGGRELHAGDVLHISSVEQNTASIDSIDASVLPVLANEWQIRCLYGPHGAPDFFTNNDIDMFFSSDWEVHYNSSRTGVRLVGPKPEWARDDGGEAGLHPSNIHDNAYAIGSIDFTGDMPIILGPDGPSLGGFVCPATIIKADLWKIGQLKPGDKIRFIPVAYDTAATLEQQQEQMLVDLEPVVVADTNFQLPDTPVLTSGNQQDVDVCYRPAGEDYVLIEYGPNILDLNLRFRVHVLMQWLHEHGPKEIIDLTPGIRSLQVHYDNQRLPQSRLLEILETAEKELPAIDEIEVPTRIVHLPLSWDDAATRLAIDKYMQSVRSDAPWCPSNIEFIRRINGLDSIDEVKQIFFDASYLVMGLGDVYLGAPVATPVDPRHRLVTTKYNPARTWTPENAVGIGGAYLCVYGMEGPGGYQFVGRTVQMWNRFNVTNDFRQGKPWLLDFFDQLRFYPVSHDELTSMRQDFPAGKFSLKIEHDTFRLRDYQAFLENNSEEIAEFKHRQQQAFNREREQWQSEDRSQTYEEIAAADDEAHTYIPAANETVVKSPVTGSVWQLQAEPEEHVEQGQLLLILESMKMEIQIKAPADGKISKLFVCSNGMVNKGQNLLVLEKKS